MGGAGGQVEVRAGHETDGRSDGGHVGGFGGKTKWTSLAHVTERGVMWSIQEARSSISPSIFLGSKGLSIRPP